MAKIGRNDPCPCGSGLKLKRCCVEIVICAACGGAVPINKSVRMTGIKIWNRAPVACAECVSASEGASVEIEAA